MWAILLALIIVNPIEPIERCDLIELNHCHNAHGSFTFDQIIFWDWADGSFRCIGWMMASGCRDKTDDEHRDKWRADAFDYQNYPGKFVWNAWLPRKHRSGRWMMHDLKRDRRIESMHFRETWTRHDPSRADLARAGKVLRRL